MLDVGIVSSSLPRPSGEGRYSRYGGYDGLGSLGLALRKFLAFVLELKERLSLPSATFPHSQGSGQIA